MSINNNHMKYELASSALRVYLTYTLQQTEDISRYCRSQMPMFSAGSVSRTKRHWQLATDAANKVIASIEDHSDDVGALSIISSLQDALREALRNAKKADTYDNSSHATLSNTYAVRAKYLTYGFASRDTHLSSLWFLAAQHVQWGIELKFDLSRSTFYDSEKLIEAATAAEKTMACMKSAVQAELCERVKQHYRYAAALTALGRKHSHDFAAEVCLEAFQALEKLNALKDPSFVQGGHPATPGELVLLERAAAHWHQAVGMVEAQDSNARNLRDDPDIRSVLAAARKSTTYAHMIGVFTKTLDERKAVAAAIKDAIALCQDDVSLPLWRALATDQDKAVRELLRCIQLFIDDKDGADKISISSLGYGNITAGSLEEPLMCNANAVRYKRLAVQTLQGTRPSLLASKCWTKAAVYIEEVARMHLTRIAANEASDFTSAQRRILYFRTSIVENCVNIAENVLGSAVEYMDKARGAEAGEKSGRDPREAQMCRRAAECLLEKAELMWEDIIARKEDNSTSSSYLSASGRNSEAVREMGEKIKFFVEIAEYLHLAFKHRALPDADSRQNGTLVAVLYECVVKLMACKAEAADSDFVVKIINQVHALIKLLNKTETVPPDLITTHERMCGYGALACAAHNPILRKYWIKANDLLSRTLAKGTSRDKSRPGSAAASLYACAARAKHNLERMCYSSAARALATAFASMEKSIALVTYYTLLARSVLLLGDVFAALPEEVTTFLETVQQKSAEEEEMRNMAEEHARCGLLQIRCRRERSRPEQVAETRAAWMATQVETSALLRLFSQRAEDFYVSNRLGHLAVHISFQSLVVKCYASLAEAEPGSDSAAAWKKAVEVCEKTRGLKSRATDQEYRKAIVELEHAVQAAQVHVVGDS